ncbi:MAG: hypothetical protein ACI9WU_000980 [Myxococcota bacterium]|jgi:uncharacterized protein (TIGR04551 family)
MRHTALAALLTLALAPCTAEATGFTDFGQNLTPHPDTWIDLHGSFRIRGTGFYNLDLDRGPTPSGEVLFPVSAAEPDRQWFFGSDLRVRTDLAIRAPGGVAGFKLRMDVLDNMPLGGSTDGIPGASLTQAPPESFLRIKHAYGEILTPLGYLAAGRMGHHFGLGMLGNGGDCADCDSGDAADRIAFITPLAGHVWALAYDFSAVGHLNERRDESLAIDVEPSAAVRSLSFALLRWDSDSAIKRRLRAGRTTVNYGGFYAYRWQDTDIPANYLPIAAPPEIDAAQVVRRGLTAHAADLWLRVIHPWVRVELEAAFLHAEVEQASAIPGLELANAVTSNQFGVALESEIGPPGGRWVVGLDAGFASGDPAPGFGAQSALSRLTPPQPGDLDGPQGVPPGDTTVDNFRFHRDYRIDRILFREIIGTVTDAAYIRPHARVHLVDWGTSRLVLSAALIASWAHEPTSTLSGDRALGIELDPTLSWVNDDGFSASLEYAVLVPQAGLNNPALGLDARVAQLLRLRAGFGF